MWALDCSEPSKSNQMRSPHIPLPSRHTTVELLKLGEAALASGTVIHDTLSASRQVIRVASIAVGYEIPYFPKVSRL